MAVTPGSEILLSLVARTSLVPVAVTCVEESAAAFGLDQADALPLTLAAEEIFGYLCQRGAPGQQVTVRCRNGGYYVEAEFLFQPHEFDMRAFNLTAVPSFDSEGDSDESSLLIASRMVDRFHFASDEHGLRVRLVKERTYPEISQFASTSVWPLDEFRLRSPDPEELKEFVRLVHGFYAGQVLPPNFRFPGKVVDMASAQVYRATLACDDAGHIGGGMVWRFQSQRMVVCYGPYIFGQPRESRMAQWLVEACIGSVARTEAVGIINRYPTAQLPTGYFEKLGSLIARSPDDTIIEVPTLYRHLREDDGAKVRTHPLLVEFLEREYQRLCLAREIMVVQEEGEMHSRFSVISAEFDRAHNMVTLRPTWWGADAAETLAGNVEILRKDGIQAIFFETDLGKPWQSYFNPALEKNGFQPRLILPYCGKGDIVVFQHHTGV